MKLLDLITNMQEKEILVTGGAGFIGSHLVDFLIKGGKTVRVIDNLSSGYKENLKKAMRSKNFTFIKADLLDQEKLTKAVEGCELVFHLAANPEVRIGASAPEIHFNQNTLTTFNLLEAMRKVNSVKGLVFTSSSTVYGDAEILPTPENFAPLKPISIYGAAKLASEALISSYAYTYGFKAVVCRLANIIGPRAQIGVIRDFLRKLRTMPDQLEILGDGTQSKSYLHVDECIECLVLSYVRSQRQVEFFNVGSEDQVGVLEIARIVTDVMGLKDVEFVCTGGVDGGRGWKGDVKFMELDISQMKKLGWSPRRTSYEAVRDTARVLLKEEIALRKS